MSAVRKTARRTTKVRVKVNRESSPAAVAATLPTVATSKVKLAAAKGRPMLSWVGKRPLREVVAFPAQQVERFSIDAPKMLGDVDWSDWPDKYERGGLLFHGDNKEVLAHLLSNGLRGKVDLIYIDPPFDSGADYVRRVELRGAAGTARLDGEGYTLGEQLQYTDIWANDNYLQFMYERLLLLKEILASTGSIYLHCDWRRAQHLRAVMDEVFGSENLLNEVIWYFANKIQGNVNRFATNHHNLLYYAKSKDAFTFHRIEEERERPIKVNKRYWDYEKARFATERDAAGKVVYTERAERIIDDVWVIPAVSSDKSKQVDYPTQKPDELLERVVVASSNPGDIVLDCFMGSGVAPLVAQRLGRRWIGCDINKGSIQTATKQLMKEMTAQAKRPIQTTIDAKKSGILPAQLQFSVHRVNDYDLVLQHTEAVNLACETLGVVRSRTDAFFDGTLGKKLVKVVPFDHSASPVDLEEIAQEIRNRPNEERDIVVVCLGKELACDPWLADHNRRGAPNKIQIVELRTDPKYGGIFTHVPASARVKTTRKGARLSVVIEDFVSPTIIERLKAQEGLVAPKITDWRQMVDSVFIDDDYDGKSFNVAVADVPARKDDFVAGNYEIDAPKGKARVAVKITDMLGEEVLVVSAG